MTIFYDDFERANGGLGTNWTDAYSTSAISNGAAVGSSGTFTVCNTVSDSGRHEAEITFLYISGQTYGPGVGVKMSNSARAGYWALVWNNSGSYTFALYRRDASANTLIDSEVLGSYPYYSGRIRIEYDTDTVTATLDGGHTLSAQDTTYALNTYMGMYLYGASTPALSFRCVGGAAIQFDVTPSLVGNYGDATTMTLTGTGTAWTSGTPGAPTFTADHGTLSGQVVASATSATVSFDPGDYLGPVVFTDPSTGLTDTVMVTSDTGVLPPGGEYLFTPQAVAMVNNTAGESWTELLLKPRTDIEVTAESTFELDTVLGRIALNTGATVSPASGIEAGLLHELWRLVNGGYTVGTGPFPSPSFTTLDAGLAAVKGDLDALMGESEWTLPDLLAYLGGDPFASHRDIITALGNVGFDDTAILEAIANMQGDPLATIKAVLDYLFALRTVNEYTLGDVKTWVEAARGSGLPTIKDVADRLALIQPTTSNSLDDILSKIVGQTTLQSIIDLAVLAIAGTEGATIAAVLDGISGLADLLNGLTVSVKAPPVWPGIDGVTLGDAVALASQLTIDEPMDGCLVDVTGVDGGVAFYTYGGVKAYRNVGALCFLTDQGDLEDWQLLGREHAIYTPRTMIRAAGLKLFTGHGLAGSVTPWTVNE